jgi:hypothetical protein
MVTPKEWGIESKVPSPERVITLLGDGVTPHKPSQKYFLNKNSCDIIIQRGYYWDKKKEKREMSVLKAKAAFALGVRDSSVKSLNIMLVIWDLILLTMKILRSATIHLTLNYHLFNIVCHLGCHLDFHLTLT